ncbi:hypothetical protein [uncultured Eubacterium sp.]|uniref:hypothetical protein n=1 Tax=uncultured Eubacterium sp. TaxID=165185 RepID=UPI0026148686|nr:hypothetical protein [uncultured Eubacterium sp.]
MSAEVAAAKAVVVVASDKRGRAVIATILCSIIMLFFLPLIVYMGVMSSLEEVKIDNVQAQQMIVQNMSAEEKAKLQHIENVMTGISKECTKRKLKSIVGKTAQAVYACAFYDVEKTDNDFISKLVDCFEQAKDDDELLNMLNSTFGTNISAEDFSYLMSVISNTVIDIDLSNTDKNNLDLVKWAQMAYDNKWGYVWGSHGNVLTSSEFKRLKKVFGANVTDKEDYIKSHWLGRRTSDCVGLIKGYGWYNEESGTIKYGTNGMADVTADGMFSAATEKGPINTMPDIPGLAVWHQGHIGVYIGNGYVIHAANTYDGVIKTPITSSGWTHWLKVPYINYIEETDE